MSTVIIVRDQTRERTTARAFTDKERQFIKDNWTRTDKLLIELQEQPIFTGRTRWCDLEPAQFRILILQNMMMVSQLSKAQLEGSDEHATMRSLNFLLLAFMHCLELRSTMTISIMRVEKESEHDINYLFEASIGSDMGFPKPKLGGLRVVVDNTHG